MADEINNDRWLDVPAFGEEIPGYQPEQALCFYCEHLHEEDYIAAKLACEAFPDGIPDKFWREGEDHIAPYPGDHGITFTPKKKPSPCDNCKRRDPKRYGRVNACEIHPDRIPDALWNGDADSFKPYECEGSMGIVMCPSWLPKQ